MTDISDWDAKLKALERIIDHKIGDDVKNYDLMGQLPTIVAGVIAVQLRVMLGYVLSNPKLAELPAAPELHHVTIYDIIQSNMERILIAHGEHYYKENYASRKTN